MLKCENDEKMEKLRATFENALFESLNNIHTEMRELLDSGIEIECLVAILVSAVNDKMDQDDFNQTCKVISDLLKVIKDK